MSANSNSAFLPMSAPFNRSSSDYRPDLLDPLTESLLSNHLASGRNTYLYRQAKRRRLSPLYSDDDDDDDDLLSLASGDDNDNSLSLASVVDVDDNPLSLASAVDVDDNPLSLASAVDENDDYSLYSASDDSNDDDANDDADPLYSSSDDVDDDDDPWDRQTERLKPLNSFLASDETDARDDEDDVVVEAGYDVHDAHDSVNDVQDDDDVHDSVDDVYDDEDVDDVIEVDYDVHDIHDDEDNIHDDNDDVDHDVDDIEEVEFVDESDDESRAKNYDTMMYLILNFKGQLERLDSDKHDLKVSLKKVIKEKEELELRYEEHVRKVTAVHDREIFELQERFRRIITFFYTSYNNYENPWPRINLTENLDQIEKDIETIKKDSETMAVQKALELKNVKIKILKLQFKRTLRSIRKLKPHLLIAELIDSISVGDTLLVKDSWQCGICYEDVSVSSGAEKFRVTSCHHIFHERCIGRWNETSLTCPYCRSDI